MDMANTEKEEIEGLTRAIEKRTRQVRQTKEGDLRTPWVRGGIVQGCIGCGKTIYLEEDVIAGPGTVRGTSPRDGPGDYTWHFDCYQVEIERQATEAHFQDRSDPDETWWP